MAGIIGSPNTELKEVGNLKVSKDKHQCADIVIEELTKNGFVVNVSNEIETNSIILEIYEEVEVR